MRLYKAFHWHFANKKYMQQIESKYKLEITMVNINVVNVFKGTDQAGTFISLKCVVYYANYRSWDQSSKIQVVS